MRAAVLTLTRDRLELTRRAFASLADNAGCEFHHYVLDQGSTDGTAEWLADQQTNLWATLGSDNVGICRGLNELLDVYALVGRYSVLVKVDNDIEVVTPGTLEAVCEVAAAGYLAGPRITGLRHPPGTGPEDTIAGHRVAQGFLGGAFMAYPPGFFTGWRFDDTYPVWEGDDRQANDRWPARVLLDFEVRHDTDRHWESEPGYFARKIHEGLPA